MSDTFCRNEFGQPVGFPLPTGWIPPALPTRSVIYGDHCRLEPLVPACHAEPLFAAHQAADDRSSWTYLPYGPFTTMAEYQQWMEASCERDDPLFFAIVDGKAARAVGVASYLRITPVAGSIEVGHIHYTPRLRRTLAGTEAMYLLMKQAFAWGYRRYEWKCDALNGPSRTAAERLGFRFEGIHRQATICKGRNRDTAWYSILDGEWPKLNAAFSRWLSPDNFDDTGRQRQRLSQLTGAL